VFDTYGRYYYLVLVAVLVCAYVAWRIKTTRVGRALEAIRENEIAARATGIDATRYKIIAFVLAGAYAGLAGSLLAHDTKFLSPTRTRSTNRSCSWCAGRRRLVVDRGAILAQVLLTVLPEVLRPLKTSYIMVYGAAVVVMVIFMRAVWPGCSPFLRARFVRGAPARE